MPVGSSLLDACCRRARGSRSPPRCARSRHRLPGTQPLQAELPALELRDETPNLMLTWINVGYNPAALDQAMARAAAGTVL